MTGVDAFRKELEAYEKMKGKLLEKYQGKVVAIKDGKLVGVYDSEEEAFKDVLERYGLVPVLIKRVVDKEKLEEIPSYTYGLLGVVLTD
ncbi:hypothetical protein J7L29_01685 [Candidatus Bathyarchaeota archaeon]|nr:hypothetical protein [Candidatus Bathyarchaeota archaeon]